MAAADGGVGLRVAELTLDPGVLRRLSTARVYFRAAVCRQEGDGRLAELPDTVRRSIPRPPHGLPHTERLELSASALQPGHVIRLDLKAKEPGWVPKFPKGLVARCSTPCDPLLAGGAVDVWLALFPGKREHGSCGSVRVCITAGTSASPPATPRPLTVDPHRDPARPPPAAPPPVAAAGSDPATASGPVDGGTYRGPLAEGVPEGVGTYQYHDDYCYRGEWRAGKKHGFGRLTLPDGAYYVGNWRCGKKEGFGESWCLAEHYCGFYCNNHKHGRGLLACEGLYYETQHVNGRLAVARELPEAEFLAALRRLRQRPPGDAPVSPGPPASPLGAADRLPEYAAGRHVAAAPSAAMEASSPPTALMSSS